MKEIIKKIFIELVKEEIETEHNWQDDNQKTISFYYRDILFYCKVNYELWYGGLKILNVRNITIEDADRETDFTNLLEYLNKELC